MGLMLNHGWAWIEWAQVDFFSQQNGIPSIVGNARVTLSCLHLSEIFEIFEVGLACAGLIFHTQKIHMSYTEKSRCKKVTLHVTSSNI
jgi:hypothetical protein